MKRIITTLLAAAMFCTLGTIAYATEPAGEPPVPSVVVLSEEPKVSAALFCIFVNLPFMHYFGN